MPEQNTPPAITHPFAMLTVSQSGVGPVVNVSFNSGVATASGTVQSPTVYCHTYDDRRAPIFAISQGNIQARVSVTVPERVSDADVRTARELATAAVRYFEAIHRLRDVSPAASMEPERTNRQDGRPSSSPGL